MGFQGGRREANIREKSPKRPSWCSFPLSWLSPGLLGIPSIQLNLSLTSGLKKSAAWFATYGAQEIARHDGSSKAASAKHKGWVHKEALAEMAKEKERASAAASETADGSGLVQASSAGTAGSAESSNAASDTAAGSGAALPQQPLLPPATASPIDCSSINQADLFTWMQGLYWAAKARLTLNQMQSFQAHEALLGHPTLKTHHSRKSLKDGLLALYISLKEDLMDKLNAASVWSLMLDGVTEPVKQFNLIVTFVERSTGKLRTECYDLVELSGGVILKWDDEEVRLARPLGTPRGQKEDQEAPEDPKGPESLEQS